jgi:hypothetical protein
MEPRNRFQGMNSASLYTLAGRYDNPIPIRFLASIDCLKIPALIPGPTNHYSSLLPFHSFSVCLRDPFSIPYLLNMSRTTTKCAKFNVVLLRQLEYRSIFWEKEYLEPNSQFFQPAWVRIFFNRIAVQERDFHFY